MGPLETDYNKHWNMDLSDDRNTLSEAVPGMVASSHVWLQVVQLRNWVYIFIWI